MPTESSSGPQNLDELFAAGMELQVANAKAGVAFWKTWYDQAAKFVDLAAEGLEAVKKDPDESSKVVKKMTDLSKENVQVFSQLFTDLGNELVDRAAGAAGPTKPPPVRSTKRTVRKAAKRKAAKRKVAKKPARRAPRVRT